MYQDLEKERTRDRCDACDHQRLQKMEKHPAVRELRDKIERLSFRLTECRNENQMLKRNLNLAKQMMCKEAGEGATDFNTMHKYGTESGWKGRMEDILFLSTQVQELQNHLKQLEGESSSPPRTPPEEFARKRLPSERKVFWRMELERRQARETAVKDIDPIVKECTELRKKLDVEKSRFRELNREVNVLRNDLQTQIDKNEEEMGLVKSFQSLENQLQETQTEIAEIRDTLVGFKSRNEKLGREISSLKEDIRILQNKAKDNNILIDTLTGKHRQIQETIEAEKAIVRQNANRYKDELKQMTDNCNDIGEMFDLIQNITHEKVKMVMDLEKLVDDGLSKGKDEVDGAKHSFSKSTSDTEFGNAIELNAASSSTSNIDESSNALNVESNGAEINPNSDSANPKVKSLMIECAKYRSLIEAAKIESDRLSYLTSVQEGRLNEVAVQVVETGRLIMQKSQEKKELLDKVTKLQKTLSGKRKKMSATNEDFTIDLRLKIEAQREDNEFLRNFLRATVENKVQDMYMYKSFVADTKSFFESALWEVKEVEKITKNSQSEVSAHTEENKDADSK